MPVTLQLNGLPLGVSVGHAAAEDETVSVRTKEFLSSEDGNDLITRLEGITGTFPSVVGQKGAVLASQVDNFLAIVSKDCKATVYCNELQQVARVRVKRAIKAGEGVSKNDIADIDSLELRDASSTPIQIPADHGFELVFSVGWRKCLYYDYSVFVEGTPNRTDNLPTLFGQFYAQLLFQELYSMKDQQWDAMTARGWFPFIWMTDQDRKNLIGFCDRDDPPLSIFEGICTNFKAVVQERTKSWKRSTLFGDHNEFIAAAVERFLEGDYVSCISVLYPRIEGLLRGLHLGIGSTTNASQAALASNLVKNQFQHSLLLPRRFQKYLTDFYFQAFDQTSSDVPLSRHTIGHGVSRAADYDFIRASLGFMILDQMFYYLLD